MSEPIKPSGPELSAGVPLAEIPDGGILIGQLKGDPVLLVRRGEEVFAIAAACAHYGAPLADGLVVGHQLRCPWHHAWFDVRSGEAVGPPALRSIDTWEVERSGTTVKVKSKRAAPAPAAKTKGPSSVVIIGAGAVGDAAADMLRRKGYDGPITLIAKGDEPLPVDRPNLSKEYLDGTAPEAWVPLRSPEFYAEHRITLIPRVEVKRLDPAKHQVTLSDGRTLDYGALLLATGAAPIRLDLPGANLPHVSVLRTLTDSRGIVEKTKTAKQVVVLGASFIGLEAAAALRKRGLEVQVVAPEALPLEKVLGPKLGAFVKALHEEKGVKFHLGRKPTAISERDVTLDDGGKLPADLVVMGVGVRPDTALAEAAGLTVNRGVVVDAYLRTSAPDIYAAGDIARYPVDCGTARIEHWVVAQRQGQVAARNILGQSEPYRAVPFFWSQHYDMPINYSGHAEAWDAVDVAGSIKGRNCLVAYRSKGRIMAIASIYRDRDSLLAEDAFSRDDQPALEKLLREVT
ncbi:MAG: FAD-dependent oxidoreductase [Pseudomonadota bacterium]|nr:FAD-dependent oxidoreductase [Gammaproteobacteria bacterium]MDQ3582906.1 FAD-dependent oxidoreductase [Pseudomonadota bacterium]